MMLLGKNRTGACNTHPVFGLNQSPWKQIVCMVENKVGIQELLCYSHVIVS